MFADHWTVTEALATAAPAVVFTVMVVLQK
jgi:hypothetical protein